MAKIFIIHGAYGHPQENWFPWLERELTNIGHKVFAPKFPMPERQSLNSWIKVLAKYNIKDVIWVAHSIGPSFVLRVLEEHKAKAAFLVAPFIGKLNNKEVDDINSSFFAKPFDWEKIKRNCKKFFVYHSDNDPYVPLEKAKEIADKLGVKVTLVKGAGHFNTASGYTKFELLLNSIKSVLTF